MKVFNILPLLGLAIVLSGCGGSSDSSGSEGPSPFAGSWFGEWRMPSAGYVGNASVDIDEDGDITGTVRNPPLGLEGPITGTIRNNGTVTCSYQYEGSSRVQLNGTWQLDSSTKMSGDLVQVVDGVERTVSFSLDLQ